MANTRVHNTPMLTILKMHAPYPVRRHGGTKNNTCMCALREFVACKLSPTSIGNYDSVFTPTYHNHTVSKKC